jgi:hypothetical protein
MIGLLPDCPVERFQFIGNGSVQGAKTMLLSRQASAEREKRATITKAEGDKLAAVNLSEAAATMARSPGAMQLRTLQTIDGLGLDKDFSQSDLDILEQAGVLSVENVPNRGLRVVHGQTTWTGDLNPLFREISVRRIGDLISYNLKTDLSEFVGEPGSVFTINAIKARVESIMVEAEKASLITPGVDNQGNPQPSYRNIHVKFNSASGICYVEVECSPVTPVNFVLITSHFRATNIVS